MTFKINADGMVDVVAMASGTGSTKEMRVESSSNLSRSEVEQLKLSKPTVDEPEDPTGLPEDEDDLEAEDMLTAEAEMEPEWDEDEADDDDDDDVDDLFFDEDDEDDVTV